MNIALERLAHSDLYLLRTLRNAENDHFFTSSYITVADQEDWWYRYTKDQHTKFYTIWLNKVTPVGFLSVRLMRDFEIFDVREIGHLLLAPAYRGRGIMTQALTEVRRLYSPLTFWVAHVKADNEASLALFERQDFCKVDLPVKTVKEKKVSNEKAIASRV